MARKKGNGAFSKLQHKKITSPMKLSYSSSITFSAFRYSVPLYYQAWNLNLVLSKVNIDERLKERRRANDGRLVKLSLPLRMHLACWSQLRPYMKMIRRGSEYREVTKILKLVDSKLCARSWSCGENSVICGETFLGCFIAADHQGTVPAEPYGKDLENAADLGKQTSFFISFSILENGMGNLLDLKKS